MNSFVLRKFGHFSEIGQLVGLAMARYCSPQKLKKNILLIFVYFIKYKTIIRSRALSFSDSDPDPSSVTYL